MPRARTITKKQERDKELEDARRTIEELNLRVTNLTEDKNRYEEIIRTREAEAEREAAIERMIREKFPTANQPQLRRLVTTNTRDEWVEIHDFLDIVREHLPVGLQRIYYGAREILELEEAATT